MISGTTERKVERYLPIDHCSEGFGWVTPDDDEELVGIPYGFVVDGSGPFIQCRRDGSVVKTVNALDLSEIVFAD